MFPIIHFSPDYKEKIRRIAKRRVSYGSIPPAKEVPCMVCGESAIDYHHGSYEWQHRYHVEAVCKPCHIAEHSLMAKALARTEQILTMQRRAQPTEQIRWLEFIEQSSS